MNLLITGSSGLIGSALVPFLTTRDYHIVRLVRSTPQREKSELGWNPQEGQLNPATLEGFEAVVHLAGENIASRRWTRLQKAKILESRSKGTRLLSDAISKLHQPPKVLIAASAIGFYGNRGSESLDETSVSGVGFLAEVCRQWEAATEPAISRGIRVVNLRLGMVLSSSGGALPRMLTPFRIGLGGKIGGGHQFVSWIAIDDLLNIILHSLHTDSLRGPVNAVSPNPLTNYDLTKFLGRILSRPTIIPLPAFAARLTLGGMADDLLLNSTRVVPKRLLETGFIFQYPNIEQALRHVLGKSR